MNLVMIAQTDRLIIRLITHDDFAAFSQMNASPIVMKHFPSTLTPSETQSFMDKIQAHYEKHGFTLYALEEISSTSFIGFCGLWEVGFESFFTPAIEIGWRLDHHFWKKGYATEAAQCILKLAFETYHLSKVVSFTAACNLESIALMKRIGLNPDGEFDHPKLTCDSVLQRHVLYQLTRIELAGA